VQNFELSKITSYGFKSLSDPEPPAADAEAQTKLLCSLTALGNLIKKIKTQRYHHYMPQMQLNQ
jgi:hypothetical protein